MKNDWDSISTAMNLRRNADAYLLRQMIDVRDRYNGDVVIPLPDVVGAPQRASLTPQIVADGIDHNAMRAASVMPSISCPTLGSDPEAKEFASIKKRALYANWHHNAVELLMYRAYRHFIGYGTASLVAMPDFNEERARFELRDPLTTYPELRAPEDFHEPINVGFVFGRSAAWLWANYPDCQEMIKNFKMDVLWDIVEWIDEDSIVVGILGPRNASEVSDNRFYPSQSTNNRTMELKRWDNRAGMVPAAVPRRATLNRIMGQLTHILPSVDALEKLSALSEVAAERQVFPDMVIFGKRISSPTLQGGKWKDGREGEPNIVLDADGVQLLQPSVGPATFATMERLERAARISGGVPELFGGVNGPGLRTGRALDSLGAFSVDPRIMEAQKFMGRALSTLNKGLMAVEKGYWPAKKYTVFSGWSGDSEIVEYTPSKHFKNLDTHVDYAMPGLDISQITVALAQMTGADLISKESARTKHPLVNDATDESQKIVKEKIGDAILMSFLQQATAGTLPLIDLVNIADIYDREGSMILAVKEADRQARERQAQAPPEPEAGLATAPETQPGLAAPGMGAEAGAGPAAAPTGPGRMQELMAALQSAPQGA